MSEWPDEWFRQGSGAAKPQVSGGPADPTVQVPRPDGSGSGAGGAGAGGAGAGGAGAGGAGGWPEQPPLRGAGGGGMLAGLGSHRAGSGTAGQQGAPSEYGAPPGLGAPPGGSGGGRRAWLRPRRIVTIVAVVVALLLVAGVSTYFYLDSKLTRQNVLVDYTGRPAASAGQNWLITGSDSRQGLTRKQEARLSTGFDVGGHRSDTILLLHVPANGGRPVLISLPRDSYVPIPGYGMNKINAAFAFGGPKLLAKTVQNATGLRIDHYMGIGFGGFVGVVNAVGGVNMCIKHALHDTASGLNLKRGCQTLSGAQALGYVRDRHDFAALQDLQRIQDQRLFIKALLQKVTSPGVMLNPFAAIPAAIGTADNLTVDQGTSLYQLIRVAFALRDPLTTTVPIATANLSTPAGDAVEWDQAQALELFHALKHDRPVPRSLITGSRQGA